MGLRAGLRLALFFGAAALCALPALGGETAPPAELEEGDAVEDEVQTDAIRTDIVRADTIRVVRGRVRLVGNHPFTELLIAGEDGVEWYIERGEGRFLEACQQRIVTVRGKARNQELLLANGVSLGSRWVLRDISLVSPEPGAFLTPAAGE
jgi:hypothetical protein